MSYKQNENILIIETEINGFTNIMIPFYLIGIIVYSLFIGGYFFGENFHGDAVFVLPFILLHASFMFGLPYFLMKSSAKRMKRELELDFFYMTKKSPI